MSQELDRKRIERVLILRTDHLGDLLLSTPLIRALRSALPGRHFTLVASPANAGALQGWDALNEIIEFDPGWPLAQRWRFGRELGRQRWDLCLVLSPRTPSYLLGWLSGAPIRAGIVYSRRIAARLLSPWWLTHPVVVGVDELLAKREAVPHEVKQLAQLADILGLPHSEPGPLEYPLNQDNLDWADAWLQQQVCDCGCDVSGPLIGIHGAGKWWSAGWTDAHFFDLIHTIQTDDPRFVSVPNARVLVTFGPGDRELEQAVLQRLQAIPHPQILLPGSLSVPRWAALLSRCDAVISPDTGSLHLAAAVERPVVAMYEADSFLHCSTQWAPWHVPHAIVRRGKPAATIPVIVAELLRLLQGKNHASSIAEESDGSGESSS